MSQYNWLYHEKQQSQDCSIHAFNNAMQYRALTNQQAVEEVQRNVEKWIEARKQRYNDRIQQGLPIRKRDELYTPMQILEYSNGLSSNGTLFSASIIQSLARKINIGFIPETVTSNGSYYILGTSHTPNGGQYPHAIACYNGNWIDSEYDKIFKGKPWHFKSYASWRLVPLDQVTNGDQNVIDLVDDITPVEPEILPIEKQIPLSPPKSPVPHITAETHSPQQEMTERPIPFNRPSKKFKALVATNFLNNVIPPLEISRPTKRVKRVVESAPRTMGSKKARAMHAVNYALAERSMLPMKQRPPAARKGSTGGGNSWVFHVKHWAAARGMSYGCAVTDPQCRADYKSKGPKVSLR